MKREFLQALKVGDAPLPKEVIDAIMDENGKDIVKAKADAGKLYGDYDALKEENARLKLLQEQSAAALAGVKFQSMLDSAILTAGGRNTKAISALLDVDALRASEDPNQAVANALQALKAEQAYLFGRDVPPAFAPGTGTKRAYETAPVTLAGALREKFERK